VREGDYSASSSFLSKNSPVTERDRDLDIAILLIVGYSTYEWACLKERLLEAKQPTVIEAAQLEEHPDRFGVNTMKLFFVQLILLRAC